MFNWFGKSKSDAPQTAPRSSSGLANIDATLPNPAHAKSATAVTPAAGGRKQERHAMRELLYTVVREAMNKMGVLSSSYKFKVLSLDARGRQYLVMMDVARLQTGEVARMAEIEALIAHTAKVRHEILVTAVYWRVSDQVTSHLPSGQPAAAPAAPAATPAPAVAKPAKSPYDPIDADEVNAFKKALAGAPRSGNTSGELLQSGPMLPPSDVGFADTEIDERATPLSSTQYGDL